MYVRKEPEPIYLGFTNRVIGIILTQNYWDVIYSYVQKYDKDIHMHKTFIMLIRI